MANGRDTYFKRAAQRKAEREGIWLENPISSSYFFHLKWDYCDSNINFEKIRPLQYVNHYPDSRELTTKSGLTKNLNSVSVPGIDLLGEIMPRSYDLSDTRQMDMFLADFN